MEWFSSGYLTNVLLILLIIYIFWGDKGDANGSIDLELIWEKLDQMEKKINKQVYSKDQSTEIFTENGPLPKE